MLTESLVLALPGGAAGIGLAWLAVHMLDATKPAILVRYPAISMDWRVLAFTIALLLAASLAIWHAFPRYPRLGSTFRRRSSPRDLRTALRAVRRV